MFSFIGITKKGAENIIAETRYQPFLEYFDTLTLHRLFLLELVKTRLKALFCEKTVTVDISLSLANGGHRRPHRVSLRTYRIESETCHSYIFIVKTLL